MLLKLTRERKGLSQRALAAKAKMSQNREPRDRAGVARGLADRAQGDDRQIASLVEKLNR